MLALEGNKNKVEFEDTIKIKVVVKTDGSFWTLLREFSSVLLAGC